MSTPIDGTTYPFDPTGQLASNLITGEMQALVPGDQGNSNHFIVPELSPYFVDSLVMQYKDTAGNVKTLVEGVDYIATHVFHDASLACATPIAGSISFYNLNLAGQVQLKYQTLGGIWSLNEAAINTILADRLHNPRITTWEQVTDQPVTFPVIDHEWNLVDLVGMSEVLAELQNIEAVLRDNSSSGLAAHIADHNNPHFTDAEQVGLDLVMNYAMAANSDAVAGVRSDLYMAPSTTTAAIAAAIAAIPSPGIPTAAQVGAYTTAETDALLANKLDTTAQAADSALFGGQSPSDFTAAVLTGTAANAGQLAGMTPSALSTQILSGTAANSNLFGGLTPAEYANTIAAGSIGAPQSAKGKNTTDTTVPAWTRIGYALDSAEGTLTPDVQLIVGGADSYNGAASGLYLVTLNMRGATPVLSVISLNGVNTGGEFGWLIETDPTAGVPVIDIWVKSPVGRNTVTTTSLMTGLFTFTSADDDVTVEPAGIAYATADSLVLASDFVAVLTNLTTAVDNLTTQITGE